MSPLDPLARSTLDHLLEGFQVIGPDWTYVYVNPAAARQGRSTPVALEGQHMWDVYPGLEKTPLFEVLNRVMDTRVAASFENLFTFPDGSSRWFELRIDPVPQGICIHSVDIEQRKQAENALRALNDQLEHRMAERSRALETLRQTMSQGLRPSLRAIAGFSAILAETSDARLDEEGRECVHRIQEAANRMGRLLEELLNAPRPLGQRPEPRRH